MAEAFTALWFSRCQATSLKITSHAKEVKDYPTLLKMNAESNSETAEAFKISLIQSYHIYEGGSKIREILEADSERLKAAVKKYNRFIFNSFS